MIEQTTLHNILTWVIAVILFIFQSLNYFIAWIKKYVKHGQKTTTVVTADTTISSESNLNNNVPENVITEQGLVQKHFDIPLIIAEDEPKVNNFNESAQLLTSNEIYKEKTKIDQFMDNLVDDSYVARGLGLITATVGRQSEFYLYSKYDNNFENVVIRLNGRNGEIGQVTILSQTPENIFETKSIPMEYFYDKDRIKVTYTPFAEGVYTLTLVRNSLSICRSPYYISVEKSPTNSRSQIRLGTKKYKPVTKFAKAKHPSLETCDNSIPVIEPRKQTICRNILPSSEENSIRTDVMSIVTKFESNSINVKKRVHKRTSSISENGSETDLINEISTYSNIQPKIETNNVYNTYVSDLNSPSIHSKSKSTDKKNWNNVDITYRNSDVNAIDFESERIKKPLTKLNECIGITKDIPEVKNLSLTHIKPTNSVLVESLNIENSHDVEIHSQTFKITELIDEKKHIETLLDPTTEIDESEVECIDNEPCIQNEVSCFDDDDRKTVVVMEKGNEIKSISNDTVIQQITDSAQYNINTPFASIITKITNSICEKCSIQVLKIISELPRDINITHNNNSNEICSSFETLLAQPISININIDNNMFEQSVSATNEHNSEHLMTNSPTKIKRIGTTDKDIKCHYHSDIEPIDNNSDEHDINIMSKELMIKQNKQDSEIGKTIKDEIIDHCIIPFAEHTIDKHKIVHQNNELPTNGTMKIKYSTNNEENVLHSKQFNNNSIHKSDNEIEIQEQHLQKSSENNMDLIKTNQFHENINKELNDISKESNEPLDTSDLVTMNYDKNPNEELVTDEFKIKNIIIPDENTNIQSSVINNIVLESMELTLATSEYNSEDNKEQTNNISYENVTLPSSQNEIQKLMIEKSIEPVLISFKNKMVEKITQLYLNKDLSNTDYTSIFETHDNHLTNNFQEFQINKDANSTEINTRCIETLTSQLKNQIDKNVKSEIILDQKKPDNNHLFKYVENIIKANINPSGLYAQPLSEKKLQTLVNTAMNHPNDQQIVNQFQKIITDNETQDNRLKNINNVEIAQDIEAMLVETPSATIIKNTDELISSKNEETVKCKIPLINDFDAIKTENTNTDIKQEMQTIDVNENLTIVETNTVEKKALENFQKSHNTEIITPIVELRSIIGTQIINTSETVTVEEHSSKEIQTTTEITESINIPEETNVVLNIDDKNEYESVKLQIKENDIIKIPHLVEKETVNEIVENINTNISTKSNSTENISMQLIKKQEVYQSKPDKNVDEMLICTESETTTLIDTSTGSLVRKIVVEIVTNKNKTPIERLEIIVHEKIEENIVTVPEKNSTMSFLVADEQVKIKNDGSDTHHVKSDNNVTNTETKHQNPIDHNNVEKKIEKESPVLINTLTGVVMEEPKMKILTVTAITSSTNSSRVTVDVTTDVEKVMEEVLIDPSDEVVGSNLKVNMDRECETILPIESTVESVAEPEIDKEITETEILPCTDSSTATVDVQTDVEKIIEEEPLSPINSLDELVQENMITDINTEDETLIPIKLTMESIEEPKVVEDITGMEIRPSTNSSSVMLDTKIDVEKVMEEVLIDPSDEVVGSNLKVNMDRECETILPIELTVESVAEPEIDKEITETEILPCTDSSTATVDVQTDVEKVKEEELIDPSDEVVGSNLKVNMDIEYETILPIESTVESVAEPEIDKDITETEILSCTDSSTATVDVQTDVKNVIEEESSEPTINSLDEVVEENTNINTDNENEILLPIDTITGSIEENKEKDGLIDPLLTRKSIIKFIEEPKEVEGTTETEILSRTEPLTKPINHQSHGQKIIDEVPINYLDDVVGENMNVNIATESETLLLFRSTMGSTEEPKVVQNTTGIKIPPCSGSSTLILNMQMDDKNANVEASPASINNVGEVLVVKMTVNIGTENETQLLIESTMESREKQQVETEMRVTEITSCTESFTVPVDAQTNVEKVIIDESPAPINSLGEVMEDYKNVKIDIENKTPLPIELTVESIAIPKAVKNKTATQISSSTDPCILTVDDQTDVEKGFDKINKVQINSLCEVVGGKNNIIIDTQNEKILPVKTYNGSVKDRKLIEGTTEIVLPIESTMEPKEETKELEGRTVTETTSCTNSLSVIVDTKIDVEKVMEEVLIDNSDEVVGSNLKVNMDIEYETILPIESTIESIEEPKVVEDITGTEILLCTDSSTATVDEQTNIDKMIEEVCPALINSSDKVVEENMNVNIDNKNETLLPIELTKESTPIPKTIDNIMETEIQSCTDSCIITVDNQTYVEKNLTEVTPDPITSLDEVLAEKTNTKIDTGNETILPIKISTGSLEDTKVIEGTTEIVLPIESTMEPKEEPKVVEYITVNEKTSCTDSSYATVENKINVENVIEEVPPVLINSSSKKKGEKTNVNIVTENETVLPIGLKMESAIEEPNVVEDITGIEIRSSVILNTKRVVEKVMEEVLIDPSDEVVGNNKKLSIDIEYETILPIESTIESIAEPEIDKDITETEILSCTDSSTTTVDVQTVVEKVMEEVLIDPSDEVVGNNKKLSIDIEYETILPIESTIESIAEPEIDKDITETEILSCTDSSTATIDMQTDVKKVIEEVLIDPSDEVVGSNLKVNMDIEYEIILPIESTVESVAETEIDNDITETEILSCTDSSTATVDVQKDVEKVIEEVCQALINSSDKVSEENMNVKIDKKNETFPTDRFTEFVKEKKEIYKLIESTVRSIEEPKVEGITEPEIKSCTESSTIIIDDQKYTEKILDQELPATINFSDVAVEENMNLNIDTENEMFLPIVSITETVEKPEAVEGLIASKIPNYTESLTEMIDMQMDPEKIIVEPSPTPTNSQSEVVGEKTKVNFNTESETLLPNTNSMEKKEVIEETSEVLLPTKSAIEFIQESKVEEDIKTDIKITSCADSSSIVIQTDIEKVMKEESSEPTISSLGEVVEENMNGNIDKEIEILLPIYTITGSIEGNKEKGGLIDTLLTIDSIEVSKEVKDINETKKIPYPNSTIVTVDVTTDVEKTIEEESQSPIDYFGELVMENKYVNINTKNKTLLPIESAIESNIEFIEESKVVDDITEIEITSCTQPFTKLINTQNHTEKMFDEVPITSLSEVMGENMIMHIVTEIETHLSIGSTEESMVEPKVEEDTTITALTSFTDSSILTKEAQTNLDKVIEKKSPSPINFLGELLGENMKVNNDTKSETLLQIDSAKELTLEPKVEAAITETTMTLCTNSSTVTVDVQTDLEKVIVEVSAGPINSTGEVVGKSTNLNIDTENETHLQIDTSTTAVEAVIEEKLIENEYSTPTVSSFLGLEKQINVIIDSKIETLLPIDTNTTFVDETNMVGYVSENEHVALIDSSITSVKQPIKIDTETEIGTLLLVDNLTESVKEQIVEKITESKTPTLIDSLAEVVGEGSKVNIGTDNQTLLTINTSSTIIGDQIVKNCIENETQTPIYSVMDVAEEQMKVNIETNNETITPIDIFTTSVEEQLNLEYLCENENTIHIDLVTTMIKNQMKIDIETENKTLLSLENTSVEEKIDEVDKIIQNDLLVDFSAATELKAYEIVTDTETETSTSIDTLNTTVDRQTVIENFKKIENTKRIAASTTFEDEQKAVEHITVIENVLSIGTSTASVEEDIQEKEVIQNESTKLIMNSTTHDVASLEEPKIVKNETTAMISSVAVVEEQMEVAPAEVVIDTCTDSLDKTVLEKITQKGTPTPTDILVSVAEKQTDLEKVEENEIPILVYTSTESVEKPVKTEKVTVNKMVTPIACEALVEIETNKFEVESENETSTPVNKSASIAIEQIEVENLTEKTFPNDDAMYRNSKTNLIDKEVKTENSDNPNEYYLKFGESSKMHLLENEDNLQRESYGIQKLEMSVQRIKTSDDYYEKTLVQLEQTEKISKVDKVNVDGENKTIIDDKSYTVNESDLNAILCASSLEEALTLLDSKIKFKFKHKKSSSKINSAEYIPKIQTSDSKSSSVNTNFTDAREFFKEIEKKSKK